MESWYTIPLPPLIHINLLTCHSCKYGLKNEKPSKNAHQNERA